MVTGAESVAIYLGKQRYYDPCFADFYRLDQRVSVFSRALPIAPLRRRAPPRENACAITVAT